MRPEPRPEFRDLAPAVHGGDAPQGVRDFSTGVSPLAPPSSVLAALRNTDVTRYPHPTALPLREALAAAHGCSPEEIVAGAGAVELIWALARAFAGIARHAVVFGPAFGEYAQAVRASGARPVEVQAAPPFTLDRDAALRALSISPSLAFLCRPSNPCLNATPTELIDELAAAAPRTLFVIDEAYLPLFDGVDPVPHRKNVVVIRSLTKVFALPGLRFGYLLGDTQVTRALQAALPPWNVSTPACEGGIAAIYSLGRVGEIRRAIGALRVDLMARLGRVGATIEAAGGPFVLCRVDGAAGFSARLLEAGFRVRDCTSFGMPDHVRVGVRNSGAHDALARAWAWCAQH